MSAVAIFRTARGSLTIPALVAANMALRLSDQSDWSGGATECQVIASTELTRASLPYAVMLNANAVSASFTNEAPLMII
jgi:hypothetical protein